MAIQAEHLRQLDEVSSVLTLASARLVNHNRVLERQIADFTTKFAELQAENRPLRDLAATGAAGYMDIAAAITAPMEAAEKLGAPSEATA